MEAVCARCLFSHLIGFVVLHNVIVSHPARIECSTDVPDPIKKADYFITADPEGTSCGMCQGIWTLPLYEVTLNAQDVDDIQSRWEQRLTSKA